MGDQLWNAETSELTKHRFKTSALTSGLGEYPQNAQNLDPALNGLIATHGYSTNQKIGI
jgi:hypothetical protein